MFFNTTLTLDDGGRCFCVLHLGKIVVEDKIITKASKLSYKYDTTYMID